MSYQIEDKSSGLVIRLDATTQVEETHKGRITSNPVADSSTVSDSFIKELPSFTITGVVASVGQPFQKVGRRPIAEVTQDMLDTLNKGTIVSFLSGDRLYRHCIIELIKFSKTSREGKEGWTVVINLRQINLVGAASIILDEEPLGLIKDNASGRNNKNSSTTREANSIIDVNKLQDVLSTFSSTGLEEQLTSQGGG